MGAYQFIRIEAYGRAASKKGGSGHSVRSIIAEASREPDAVPHVEAPCDPTLRHGVPLDEVERLAHKWAEGETDSRGHKLRKDATCLLAGVFSAPDGFDEWEGLRDRAIDWLKTKYGDRLVSVVEHEDERHKHCHFYCIARPGERFDTLHDGRAAFNEAKASGLKKHEAERAAATAMRGFQDRYFVDVASRHGLTRVGPKRPRWTREEWRARNHEAIALRDAFKAAERETADAASRAAAVRELEARAQQEAAAVRTAAEETARVLREAADAAAASAALDRAAAAADADAAAKAKATARAAAKKAADKLRVATADREDAGARWDAADERLRKVRARTVFWRQLGAQAGNTLGGFGGAVARAFAWGLRKQATAAQQRAAEAEAAAKAADGLKAAAERDKQALERERNALKRDLPAQLDAARAAGAQGAQADLAKLRESNGALQTMLAKLREQLQRGRDLSR